MKFTNKHNLPTPLAKALASDSYSRGHSRKSVTQLISAPQIDILSRLHADEMESDVSQRMWALLGTTVHKIIEEGAKDCVGYIPEERLFLEVDGWIISGGVDVQHYHSRHHEHIRLIDWKTTSSWAVLHEKPEWQRQLNCYAYLVEKTKGLRVNQLQVGAIIRDWSRREAQYDRNYPQAPVVMIDIPTWGQDEREQYVKGRVRLHQDAERMAEWGDPLPECTKEDMWERDTKWAVKKPGAKRASKVFDNPEDAAHMAREINGFVEERPGERVRCEGGYCPASPWCAQYKRYLEWKNDRNE